MTKITNFILVGDVHGEWAELERVLERVPSGSHVLVIGDFGFYPGLPGWPPPKMRPDLVKMWFRGNHENHMFLVDSTMIDCDEPVITPGSDWWFIPDGTVFDVNGKSVLIVGGGDSIDADQRKQLEDTLGIVTWFPEEEVSLELIEQLKQLSDIDIVLSHTPPSTFYIPGLTPFESKSRNRLASLQEALKPRQWFFGDMHRSVHGRHNGTYWVGLDIMEVLCLTD